MRNFVVKFIHYVHKLQQNRHMAVIITKEIRRRRALLIASGALLIVMALVLFLGLNKNTPSSEVPASVENPEILTPPASDSGVSDLKVGVFEDERFKALQDPPGLPVESKTTGKLNPFSD